MNKILYRPKPGTTGFFYIENYPQVPAISMIESDEDEDMFELQGERYLKEIQSAKEEAIKNGEIVNPDLLFEHYSLLDTISHKDGDKFDLPEGVTVEKDLVDFDKNGKVIYRGFRIVPLKDQEDENANNTSDELWAKVIMDARHYDGSPKYLRFLIKLFRDTYGFTIQRKTK